MRPVERKPVQVLILDPTTDETVSIVSLLRQNGYHTVSVASVHQAREAFEQNSFDVFMLDIRLPDGDGLLVCNEVRERIGNDLMIIVTGKCFQPEVKVAALQIGADAFFEQPYEGEELLARVVAYRRRQLMYAHNQPWSQSA